MSQATVARETPWHPVSYGGRWYVIRTVEGRQEVHADRRGRPITWPLALTDLDRLWLVCERLNQ